MCVLNILIVAYFTLQERIVLASTQLRKGPNVVGFLGIAQPLADAFKLLLKEIIWPYKVNKFLFVLAPFFMLLLSLCLWNIFFLVPFTFINIPPFSLLFPLLFSSLNVLLVIFIGWSANSKYTLQGALRCISQLVSYELVFSLVFLTLVLGYNTLEIINIINQQKYTWGCLDIIVFLLFFVASLAETNRTPFDLAEAESELVSGYSSVLFTYMFLAEYCYIFIISNIIVILFFGGWLGFNFSFMFYIFKLLGILYCFIWIRTTWPRFRYDQLMYFGWLELLPLALLIFIINICDELILDNVYFLFSW
jgi:NADH-quinone oxidoreductase subunit H